MYSKLRMLISIYLMLVSWILGCAISSNITMQSATQPEVKSTSISSASLNTPTATAPTPSVEKAKAIALNLLGNNGGCKLPCVWGLTPGLTTSSERQQILASYGGFSETDFSMSGSGVDLTKNPGGFGISLTKDEVSISAGVTYYEINGVLEMLSLVTIPQKNQKHIYGNNNYSELIQYYTLPYLLNNYGVPSEVLVLAFPRDPFLHADYEPFSFVVIYSEIGIMAEYISPTQWIGEMKELSTPSLWVGDIARGCPSQSILTLRTWDIKKNIPIKKIASIATSEGISETAYDYFKPIQDVTSMSINDFYEIFKDPKNTQCINVNSSLLFP